MSMIEILGYVALLWLLGGILVLPVAVHLAQMLTGKYPLDPPG